MILLLDFGNTRVKAAVLENGSLRHVDDFMKMDIDGGLWCSVHPVEPSVLEWMKEHGMKRFAADTPIPIANAYSSPETLGMDRLAAAVGAWSMQQGHDLLVVDAGTAITYDFVSADGVYHGGNIAPGIGLRFKALHEHTGALPLVDAKGDIPMFGKDTETAIRSGVINGVRKELEGYLAEMYPIFPSLLVFLTGGDAEFFEIKAKSTTFAVPDLVLRGLARITEYNEKGF
ncbi:MAG: type III pantothenate kinase [Bacteroidaceae bacterium]|nr:type III pantothenate kinase [Bacteroidaceae bacterium]